MEEKHELFKQLLNPKTTKAIKEFRGIGLMLAVEFESSDFLQKVIAHCLDLGLLSDWFLYCDNSMRIAPPLNYYKKRNKKSLWDYFRDYSFDGRK